MIVVTPQEIIDKCPSQILSKIERYGLDQSGDSDFQDGGITTLQSPSTATTTATTKTTIPNLNQLIKSTLATSGRLPLSDHRSVPPPSQSISININDVILDVENLPHYSCSVTPQQQQQQQQQQHRYKYQYHPLNYAVDPNAEQSQRVDLDSDEGVEDPDVVEYLKFKRDHQLKFLKEVQSRGLVLKGNGGGGSGGAEDDGVSGPSRDRDRDRGRDRGRGRGRESGVGVGQSQTSKFMNY
ncbi:hypothetical protein KGF57_000681 [Candida theae]|uniref:Uncharacterized protein n=1 Tax=Candida theae TaxID=1198502 RepID=A0AAD5BIF7_9ASCO|nr:uncharacterized protein KGF57_000681 [Candida theae]KAI5966016.1 hypothetical protein KGF57_000681 [Candida theae]